jgi:hypothetical protein
METLVRTSLEQCQRSVGVARQAADESGRQREETKAEGIAGE